MIVDSIYTYGEDNTDIIRIQKKYNMNRLERDRILWIWWYPICIYIYMFPHIQSEIVEDSIYIMPAYVDIWHNETLAWQYRCAA